MTAPRVLVAAFSFEANSFVPGLTTMDDFRRQTWAVGSRVRAETLGPESELAGAWAVLEEAGCLVVPAVAAAASPGAPVAPAVLARVRALLLAACEHRIAGVYLAMHGSAVSPGDDDPEGTLLLALRARLGPGVPIAISLDHHAHLTPRMVGAADVITAYRTCPHTDQAERGAQAARLLVAALRGEVRPVCTMAARPMITPADRHDSDTEPFACLMRGCDRAEAQGALAAALLPVQPWIDVPALGWKAVVTTDGDPGRAARLADGLVDAAWRVRHELVAGRRLSPDAALAEALAARPPAVFADAGDATNGGAPGDSTELLRAVLRRSGPDAVLLSVCDPRATAAAVAAGVGARVELRVGTGADGAYNAAVSVSGRVESLGDGRLVYTHPAARGTRDDAGPTALISMGPTQIVLHARAVRLIDPALYLAAGADPGATRVVQAKSQVSYRAGFASLATFSVVADTPGPTSARLERLPYRRRPVPLFPFEAAEFDPPEERGLA